jgi:hypothetical protein
MSAPPYENDSALQLLMPLLSGCWLMVLASCSGYLPGAKGSWDEYVQNLCAKDGGVIIYARVPISKSDMERHIIPMTSDGKLGVPVRELAHPESPVYAQSNTTVLRESNPEVGRVEWTVIRRSDQAVVARWVIYGRRGGDFPTGLAHESSFSCPPATRIRDELQQLFAISDS